MKRIALTASSALLLTLAACDTTSPDLASPDAAAVRGGHERVAVCHYDADADAFKLITVAAPAVQAHLRQGGGVPGGAVPGREGYVFDGACVPEGPPPTPGVLCLTDVFGAQWDLTEGTPTELFEDYVIGPLSGEVRGAYPSVATATGYSRPPDVLDTSRAESELVLGAVNSDPDGCTEYNDAFSIRAWRVGNTTEFAGVGLTFCGDEGQAPFLWSGTFAAGACAVGAQGVSARAAASPLARRRP